MYPLASQSSTASALQVEVTSMAPAVLAASQVQRTSANDNTAAWSPSLLVKRRRRLTRRAAR